MGYLVSGCCYVVVMSHSDPVQPQRELGLHYWQKIGFIQVADDLRWTQICHRFCSVFWTHHLGVAK